MSYCKSKVRVMPTIPVISSLSVYFPKVHLAKIINCFPLMTSSSLFILTSLKRILKAFWKVDYFIGNSNQHVLDINFHPTLFDYVRVSSLKFYSGNRADYRIFRQSRCLGFNTLLIRVCAGCLLYLLSTGFVVCVLFYFTKFGVAIC